MERLRQSLPTCSPAACCEAEALDDPLDGGVVSELNYGNWMSDVANRLWNIPLVRHPLRKGWPLTGSLQFAPHCSTPAAWTHTRLQGTAAALLAKRGRRRRDFTAPVWLRVAAGWSYSPGPSSSHQQLTRAPTTHSAVSTSPVPTTARHSSCTTTLWRLLEGPTPTGWAGLTARARP